MIIDLLLVLAAYLLGSVSSAIIVCRLMGLPDPRTQGSGNPGATNVLRLGGKLAAALTLAGDMLKGLLPVLVARALEVDAPVVAATGLAAFAGHLYPVFFRFQGGKGVATALGVLAGLGWIIGLAVIGIWLVVAAAFRISSLAALVAMACAPAVVWWQWPSPTLVAAMGLMSVVLFWRHRSNIRNLLSGQEGRIGDKS